MASWPSTLPDYFLQDGFSEVVPNLLIRTQMDNGPDKVRRWGTANVRQISGQTIMTYAEVAIFDTFYNTTLEGGALRFDWTHPRTEASIEFRFTDQPTYQPIGGARWSVQLNLEIMP